jgi:hypothetical protein
MYLVGFARYIFNIIVMRSIFMQKIIIGFIYLIILTLQTFNIILIKIIGASSLEIAYSEIIAEFMLD